MFVIEVVVSVVLFGIGGLLVVEQTLTVGQLVAAELIVTIVVVSLIKFGKYFENVYDFVVAFDKFGHLVDLSSESIVAAVLVPGMFGGALVRVRGLGLWYGGVAPVFAGLDLDVVLGECVAVVGLNGVGKMIFVELFFGLMFIGFVSMLVVICVRLGLLVVMDNGIELVRLPC